MNANANTVALALMNPTSSNGRKCFLSSFEYHLQCSCGCVHAQRPSWPASSILISSVCVLPALTKRESCSWKCPKHIRMEGIVNKFPNSSHLPLRGKECFPFVFRRITFSCKNQLWTEGGIYSGNGSKKRLRPKSDEITRLYNSSLL